MANAANTATGITTAMATVAPVESPEPEGVSETGSAKGANEVGGGTVVDVVEAGVAVVSDVVEEAARSVAWCTIATPWAKTTPSVRVRRTMLVFPSLDVVTMMVSPLFGI